MMIYRHPARPDHSFIPSSSPSSTTTTIPVGQFHHPSALPPAKKVKVGARASIACGTCRRRKVRCSGKFPTCSFCAARNLRCDYDGHPDGGGPLRNSTICSFPSNSQSPINPFELAANRPTDSSSLPPRDVIQDAIDAFFIHFADEGLLTFFHRPTLTRQVESDSVELEILFSVLCLAGRFCDSLQALHSNDFRQTCNFYAAQALKCIENTFYEISITRIQVHLMVGFHYCTEHEEKRGWMHIGAATRMSQLLNLGYLDDHPYHAPIQNMAESNHHDDRPPTKSLNPSSITDTNTSPPQASSTTNQLIIEHDTKRRLFWACFLIERLFGDGKERSIIIHPEEDGIITRFPIPNDRFLVGKITPTAKFSTANPPPWGPNLKSHSPSGACQVVDSSHQVIEADIFGQTMRISELWYQVFKYVGNGGRNKDRRCPWLLDSTFGKLDERLSEWEMSLPPHLQYSEANMISHTIAGSGKFYGLMHLLYFTSLLYLHRDYIPFLPPLSYHPRNGPIDGEPLWGPNDVTNPPNPDWWQTSAETCFKSAKAVTDLFIKLDHRGSRLTNPFAGFSILTAATMHLHLWFWPGSSLEIKNAGEYLALDTGIVESFKKYWYISDQWCRALNTQYTLNSLIQQTGHCGSMISPPSLLRAGLMKIINSQINESPSEATNSSAPIIAQHSSTTNPSKYSGKATIIEKVESPPRPAGLPTTNPATDDQNAGQYHDDNHLVADLVGRNYDVFAEKWPEPELLDFQATHSLIGVNHRRQQMERQQQQEQSQQEHEHQLKEGIDNLRSPSLEFTAHSSLGNPGFDLDSQSNNRSSLQDPSNVSQFECQGSPSNTISLDAQRLEDHDHTRSTVDLIPNLILNDWNSINFLSSLPISATPNNEFQATYHACTENFIDWANLSFP